MAPLMRRVVPARGRSNNSCGWSEGRLTGRLLDQVTAASSLICP
jgi:hypothetical protein